MQRSAFRLSDLFSTMLMVSVWSFAGVSIASAQTPGGNPGSTPSPGSRAGGPVAHTIRGKIFLPSGNLPDQRIRVVLELVTGGIVNEAFSDSVGNFEFRSLPSSSYKVTVPTDYRTYETTQESIDLYGNFSRTFVVQIYLKDKNSDDPFKPKNKLISVADLQEIPKPARKAYEKGLKRSQESKHEEAATLFQEALNIHPDYLYAINKLGEQYLAMNKLDDAKATFERAISVSSKFALPHINLGILFNRQQRFSEAIPEFEMGNRLDDSYPMSHLSLGLALMSQNPADLDRAEKELTRAVEMGGRNFVHARKYLFNLNIRRQNMDKAAAQLEAYLKEAPDAPDANDVRQLLSKVKKAIAQGK